MKKTVKATLAMAVLASGLATTVTAGGGLQAQAAPEKVMTKSVETSAKAKKAVAKAQLNTQTAKKATIYEAGTPEFAATIGAPFSFDAEEGTFKKAGKNYTGKYNGVMFKGGREASGEIGGKVYWEGILVHKDTFLGKYYVSGKTFTGLVKNAYYENGEHTVGIVNGIAYSPYHNGNGKLQGYSDISGETLFYKDGVPASGYDSKLGIGFLDGVPANGENGYQLATNSGKIKNVVFKDGKPIEGKHTVDGVEREYQGGIVKDGKYTTGSFHADGSPVLVKYEDGVFIKVLNWFGE